MTKVNIEIKNLCYPCADKLTEEWDKVMTLTAPFKCEKCECISKTGGIYKRYIDKDGK